LVISETSLSRQSIARVLRPSSNTQNENTNPKANKVPLVKTKHTQKPKPKTIKKIINSSMYNCKIT